MVNRVFPLLPIAASAVALIMGVGFVILLRDSNKTLYEAESGNGEQKEIPYVDWEPPEDWHSRS